MLPVRRMKPLLALAAAAWVSLGTAWAADDAALAHAKDLYLSASYDEALSLLDGLPSGSPQEALQIAEYRVFCLLALNRKPEAQQAIGALVKANPFYQPSEAVASPRIRSVFVEVRRGLLSSIVHGAYVEAKTAFDKKDSRAAALFERVLDLLADPDVASTMSDLRTVAIGFRDLSLAAAGAPSTRAPFDGGPAAAPSATGAGSTGRREPASGVVPRNGLLTSESRQVGGSPDAAEPPRSNAAPPVGADRDVGVIPPEAIYQPMPTWTPEGPTEHAQTFRGSLELSIDENGNVGTAKMRRSANPRYDDLLVKAALKWKFKAARRDGTAIPYLRVIEIELRPSRQ